MNSDDISSMLDHEFESYASKSHPNFYLPTCAYSKNENDAMAVRCDAYLISPIVSNQVSIYDDEVTHEYEVIFNEDIFDMFLKDPIMNDVKSDLNTISSIEEPPTI